MKHKNAPITGCFTCEATGPVCFRCNRCTEHCKCPRPTNFDPETTGIYIDTDTEKGNRNGKRHYS